MLAISKASLYSGASERAAELSGLLKIKETEVQVVPRMIVAYGCQLRLGSDVSEAYGADIKGTIHRRCARRKATKTTVEHTKKKLKEDGTTEDIKWQQTFTKGRVEQTFRHVCIRRAMMRAPEYAHLRMRGHSVVANTGRAAASKHSSRIFPDLETDSMRSAMASYVPPASVVA